MSPFWRTSPSSIIQEGWSIRVAAPHTAGQSRFLFYGRLSTINILRSLPVGLWILALFPETTCWIYSGLTHASMYLSLDMGFEILHLKISELKLWELTVGKTQMSGTWFFCMFWDRQMEFRLKGSQCIGFQSPVFRITIVDKQLLSLPRKERVRFDSFGSGLGSARFGSEKKHFSQVDAVWPALFGRVMVRSGSVRFRVRFRPVSQLNSSVRFGLVRPVLFLIPSCLPSLHARPPLPSGPNWV